MGLSVIFIFHILETQVFAAKCNILSFSKMPKLSQKQRKKLVSEAPKAQSPTDKVKVPVCPWGPSPPAWGKEYGVLTCLSLRTITTEMQ